MVLIDSSTWIEYDRATESAADLRLTSFIERGVPITSTEPVLMEVLAGARDTDDEQRLRRMLMSCDWLPFLPSSDFEGAASIYQACRWNGVTPRGLVDCLIAAVAIRSGAAILAHDRDFERIASVVPLHLDSYN
ncbi:MAG: PIN domain nuclease [Actinomycetota bacterium]|nr:PIN domain nuclease [Actinomycetota bacterium]